MSDATSDIREIDDFEKRTIDTGLAKYESVKNVMHKLAKEGVNTVIAEMDITSIPMTDCIDPTKKLSMNKLMNKYAEEADVHWEIILPDLILKFRSTADMLNQRANNIVKPLFDNMLKSMQASHNAIEELQKLLDEKTADYDELEARAKNYGDVVLAQEKQIISLRDGVSGEYRKASLLAVEHANVEMLAIQENLCSHLARTYSFFQGELVKNIAPPTEEKSVEVVDKPDSDEASAPNQNTKTDSKKSDVDFG